MRVVLLALVASLAGCANGPRPDFSKMQVPAFVPLGYEQLGPPVRLPAPVTQRNTLCQNIGPGQVYCTSQ